MKPNVLVVDDNQTHRLVLSAYLKSLGCNVVEAPNGQEAIHLIDSHTSPIDMVISDMWMPGMSGLELLRTVRARRPDLPIAMISAMASLESTLEAINMGAYGYVTKPFTRPQIEDLVQRGIHRADELRAVRLLRRLESLEGSSHTVIADLVVGMRHELANISQALRLNLDTIRGQSGVPFSLHQNYSDLESSLDDLVSVLTRFKEFPVNDLPGDQLDLVEIVQMAAKQATQDVPQARLSLQLPETEVNILGSQPDLFRAFSHVIRNALDASDQVEVSLIQNGHDSQIEVRDWGTGFPSEVLQKPFTPGFTTKTDESPHARGWGLFITRAIILLHRGEVQINNCAPCGAQVLIRLPIAS